MSIEQMNERIKKEVCYDTLKALSDEELIDDYKRCPSVTNEITRLRDVLQNHIADEQICQNIIDDYLSQLIPAGTKAVIRGNKFNQIIKNFIIDLSLCADRFDVCFEKKCDMHMTSEIPDWYILEKKTNRIIIGMNQLDLWGGGQQINRGSKYIENSKHNNDNSKLLCVVCNKIIFKSNKNKAYKLFEIGFRCDRLCYLNNLKQIITSYFS